MSEEVAMAKEAARGANKDKWGTALTQGIGAYLSAPTRALGAGLMAGASGYSQGAKEEQAANKDLMALQMAQKKSDLAGHRTAAEAYIGQQAKMAEKAAEAAAKREETMLGIRGNYGIEQLKNVGALDREHFKAAQDQAIQAMKLLSERQLKEYETGTLSTKSIADIYGKSMQGGNSPEEAQAAVNYLLATMSKTNMGGGSSGGGFGQPIKNGMYIK
jgi:hypothetical protein